MVKRLLTRYPRLCSYPCLTHQVAQSGCQCFRFQGAHSHDFPPTFPSCFLPRGAAARSSSSSRSFLPVPASLASHGTSNERRASGGSSKDVPNRAAPPGQTQDSRCLTLCNDFLPCGRRVWHVLFSGTGGRGGGGGGGGAFLTRVYNRNKTNHLYIMFRCFYTRLRHVQTT